MPGVFCFWLVAFRMEDVTSVSFFRFFWVLMHSVQYHFWRCHRGFAQRSGGWLPKCSTAVSDSSLREILFWVLQKRIIWLCSCLSTDGIHCLTVEPCRWEHRIQGTVLKSWESVSWWPVTMSWSCKRLLGGDPPRVGESQIIHLWTPMNPGTLSSFDVFSLVFIFAVPFWVSESIQEELFVCQVARVDFVQSEESMSSTWCRRAHNTRTNC